VRLPKNGVLVASPDDPHTQELLSKVHIPLVVTYGRKDSDYTVSNIVFSENGTMFDITEREAGTTRVNSPLLGNHNVANVTAAFALTRQLGVPADTIVDAVKKFSGVWRRFDIQKKIKGITCLDDYAHHPTEIKAFLEALRQKFPHQKLRIVYQPHQDDRFTKLFDGFTTAFDGASEVIMMEIYHVEGRNSDHDTSKRLLPILKQRGIEAVYYSTFREAIAYLLKSAEKGDIIAFVGAGDIINARERFEHLLKDKIS
jgi:UDP-N-acetylmuramate--alanine ligase